MILNIAFLFLVLFKLAAPIQEFYVTAFPNGETCPDDNSVSICEPLSFYTDRMEEYFADNTTFHFMDGVHSLPKETLIFDGIVGVSLIGHGDIVYEDHDSFAQSGSVLECSEGIGGIEFYSSESILIDKLTIANCTAASETNNVSASLAIIDSEYVILHNVFIQNSRQHGLFINNTYSIDILDSSFHKNGLDGLGSWNVYVSFHDVFMNSLFSDSWYLNIHSTNVTSGGYGGLQVHFAQQEYTVNTIIMSSKTLNNVHNLLVLSNASCQYAISMENFDCSYSSSIAYEHQQNFICRETSSIPIIFIKNSRFFRNSFLSIRVFWMSDDFGYIFIESSNFTENIGATVSAISMEQSRQLTGKPIGELLVKFKNLRFVSNRHSNALATALGYSQTIRFTVFITNLFFVDIDNCTFLDNDGSALLLFQSHALFKGETTFQNNNASIGGAILLVSDSLMLLRSNSKVFFLNNEAWMYGGAIAIEEYIPRVYTHEGNRGLYTDCFYQLIEPITESPLGEREILVFQGNRAGIAGSAVYGGTSDNCFSITAADAVKTGFLVNISTFIDQPGNSVISSDPVGVCFCENNTIDCSERSKIYQEFPGNLIEFSVVAIGDRNGTTPGLIRIENSRLSAVNTTLILSACTKLSYYLQVKDPNVVREVTHVSVFTSEAISNVLNIDVTVLSCPTGYELSPLTGNCECLEQISDYGHCFDGEMLIERAGSVWIGEDHQLNCTVVNSNCPFDFCQFSSVNVSITEPDNQCAFNRIGRLCGTCSENQSLVFGSNACKDCHSDAYVLTVLLFALAGIALVFFLFLLNLTVSVGTINGLVFFANVVKIYEPILVIRTFPVLHQFISWLNLDLGIEICFRNGMNACEKQAIQFIFPFYLWIIIVTIIIISRYSNKVAKLVSNNGIPVLAMLLLLSFTKLLRTVILVFSISYVDCDSETLLYWYLDPTQLYLHGCHRALFVFALLVLFFMITPYTLFLLLFPLFEASTPTCRRKMSWFLFKMKPFFDAYRGPHSNLCRCWPGVLLIVRVVFTLVVAISSDRNISFAVLFLVSLALISILSLGKVYSAKNYYLHSLDIFLLLGLMFLAYLFNQNKCENQTPTLVQKYGTAIVISFGFVAFIGVLGYHVFKFSFVRKLYLKVSSIIKLKTSSTHSNNSSNVSEPEVEIDKETMNDSNLEFDVFDKIAQANYAKYRESLFSNIS